MRASLFRRGKVDGIKGLEFGTLAWPNLISDYLDSIDGRTERIAS